MIDISVIINKDLIMINICKRYKYNFKKYMSIDYYQQEHPEGSYPNFFKRLYIFWCLKNEPTFEENLEVWKRNNF